MTVPTTLADLSVSEGSNGPLDSDSITATTRPSDYLRAHGAIIRTLAASSTIAAAGTTDLSTVTGTFITLTGAATTITALGTLAAGLYKFVVYNAAHTLTHNGTSLILLGGANRTVAAGDSSLFVSEGSGNWRELAFGDATGYQPLDAELTAIAALAVTDGNVIVGNGTTWVAESGATARTSLGVVASSEATAGLVELATTAEAAAGTDTARAVTAAGVEAHMTANALGWGQTWQDMTASRALSTTYTNSTGRPIMLDVEVQGSANMVAVAVSIDGGTVFRFGGAGGVVAGIYQGAGMVIVPSGSTYAVTSPTTTSPTVVRWMELR